MEKKNNRKILEYFTCEKGFYTKDNDGAAAAKAQALFIHKHGKEEFFKLQNVMHKARDFKKIQEILGQNTQEGLRILEGLYENGSRCLTALSIFECILSKHNNFKMVF